MNPFLPLRYVFSFLFFATLGTANCSSSSAPAPLENPPPTSSPSPISPTSPPCAGSITAPLPPSEPSSASGITFNSVGSSFGTSALIDLEFLPNGDLLVISKEGTVFYATNDFSPLPSTAQIPVEDGGEQGLLNVAADPGYASNCLVYFYHTPPGGGLNRVTRATVNLNLATQSFSLNDLQTIIEFSKSPDSPLPGNNHNGGGLLFQGSDNLLIGVGDGGGVSSADTDPLVNIGQRGNTRLGKILRVAPHRTPGVGGFSIPAGGNPLGGSVLPEIYNLGLRNPFTMTSGNGDVFIGDVGAGTYEEVNLSRNGGENFGWPQVEGPAGNPNFVDPIGGYFHSLGGQSIMVNHFYTGPRYQGFLSNRLIYSEFYEGFVRGILLDANNNPISESHLGDLVGMTSLQQGADGFLYAVSLFGSDQILRLELEP